DEMLRTGLAPVWKRFVIGARTAIASRLPSVDQAGAPGCGSESWNFVTWPVATSSTDICATRHMPSTLKNAIRLPSGDHAAACGCVVRLVTRRDWPDAMSWIHSCRCSLSLSDE